MKECCDKQEKAVHWETRPDSDYSRQYFGPEETGPCVIDSADWDGNSHYINIKYCPFCGAKLA